MTTHGLAIPSPSRNTSTTPRSGGRGIGRTALIACGMLASLLYAAMNVFIPMRWTEYSSASQTISELSAVGAPTRTLWVVWGVVYGVLVAAFGWGIWTSARGYRTLRVAGALLVAMGVFSLCWPPMHLRGAPFTLTDAMHIVWAVVTLLLMLGVMGFAAAAFGRRFRLYTIATGVVFLVFGALTGVDAPRIAANLPTPLIGVWERINVAAYMLWVVVLAIAVLREGVHPLDAAGTSG